MSFLDRLLRKSELPASAAEALPGREQPIPTAERHYVNGTPLQGPYPQGARTALFGLGCFWGAERVFWQRDGVISTAVGYAGGYTPNPTYEEVCSGRTGHNEVVQVVYDPTRVTYPELVKLFFESHDPTQGMRQGNDIGTQYRSGIYVDGPEQLAQAQAALKAYQAALATAGHRGTITTEILEAPHFYYAEPYHQQYLAKVPNGYCGLGGTGVACPVGLAATA